MRQGNRQFIAQSFREGCLKNKPFRRNFLFALRGRTLKEDEGEEEGEEGGGVGGEGGGGGVMRWKNKNKGEEKQKK